MHQQKGQIQVILAIMFVVGVIVFLGFRFLGGETGKTKLPDEETVGQAGLPGDASPIINNLQPSGELPLSTKNIKLTLTTNEPAYCRYSIKAGQSYASMGSGFSSDEEKTFHTVTVSGLRDGQTYKYYIRCRDLAGNKNTNDTEIRFSVAGYGGGGGGGVIVSEEAPPLRSNLQPSGALPSGTKNTKLTLTTNESAYCRYSTQAGQSYASMGSGFSSDEEKILHTAAIGGLTDNKIYEFYVRCRDTKGNNNNEDLMIRFGVGGTDVSSVGSGADATPPGRFGPSPAKDLPTGTFTTDISLKTDERATCKYDTIAGLSYNLMGYVFENTDSVLHSTSVFGLNEGQSYKYYIRCLDQYGNKNTNDFVISFKVIAAQDSTPPILKNPSHTGNILSYGTTETVISITTDEQASCRYGSIPGTSYGSIKSQFSYYDQTKLFHTAAVKGLQGGKSYDFFVRCKDLAGNANTGDVLISFSVVP